MSRTDELQATLDALSAVVPMSKADDDLVVDNISHGYDRLTGRLNLLAVLETVRPDVELEAFSAALTYVANARGDSGKPHGAYTYATRLETDIVRAGLAMDKPEHGAVQCSWEVVAIVRVGGQSRRWDKKGTFAFP